MIREGREGARRRRTQDFVSMRRWMRSVLELLRPLGRSTDHELLDESINNSQALAANLADIRVVNRWLGGTASIVRAIAGVLDTRKAPLRILDVATGSGDIPLDIQAWGQRRGHPLIVYGSDRSLEVLAEARNHTSGALRLIRHDALRLPIAPGGVDIITCAQSLHHFDPPEAAALLREFATVARRAVIVSDLRRSRLTYWGARALTLIQRSPMSRHDGPLSALRAYTVVEAQQLCEAAGLVGATVRADGLFRLVIVLRHLGPNEKT